MRRHYLFGGGNSYSSKLKPPRLLARGIECPVSPWDLPPSRWHDIYIKTPIQTLDGICVNQPKRFLPLAKEANKLAEEIRKGQVASQWAGIPHEKLLQESFVEQLNSFQILDQLAPLKAANEHLPKDVINFLEHLGKADNIPFNQLYNLVEDCADRYYSKVIKTLTKILKSRFHDRQLILINTT